MFSRRRHNATFFSSLAVMAGTYRADIIAAEPAERSLTSTSIRPDMVTPGMLPRMLDCTVASNGSSNEARTPGSSMSPRISYGAASCCPPVRSSVDADAVYRLLTPPTARQPRSRDRYAEPR